MTTGQNIHVKPMLWKQINAVCPSKICIILRSQISRAAFWNTEAKFVLDHAATSPGCELASNEFSPWVKCEQVQWNYRKSSPSRPHKLNFGNSALAIPARMYLSRLLCSSIPWMVGRCWFLQACCVPHRCLGHSQWEYGLNFSGASSDSKCTIWPWFSWEGSSALVWMSSYKHSFSTVLLAAQQTVSPVPNKLQLCNNFTTCFQMP